MLQDLMVFRCCLHRPRRTALCCFSFGLILHIVKPSHCGLCEPQGELINSFRAYVGHFPCELCHIWLVNSFTQNVNSVCPSGWLIAAKLHSHHPGQFHLCRLKCRIS